MTNKKRLAIIMAEIKQSNAHLERAFIEASLLWKQLTDDGDLKRRDDFSAYVSSSIGFLAHGMVLVIGALERQTVVLNRMEETVK